ncbi:MAG: ATP-binding protein [Spirochaetes bacterium]|nr:ATP-binding protein [Spirochaetota bacterium]
MNSTKNGKKSEYCAYCNHEGLIKNSEAYVLGEEPLSVCPKCVKPSCRCGGEEPYFYTEEGKIKQCSCRDVRLRIAKINSIYKNSGIDKKFQWRFLNEFNVRNKNDERAKKAAYSIITRFPNIDRGLYLWGNPGTGKTFLSTIILTELIATHCVSGKFMKISRNFFGKLRSTFVEGSSMYGMASQIERELAEVDILVVDDFGIQRDSAWEQETLYNLVDARYEAEKFTIFTSNLDPGIAMKDLSEGRILSRIKEMCYIIEISGPDKRVEK